MKMLGRGWVVLVLCALTAAGGWFYALHGQNEEHQVLSRDGVLMQIKQINRLESTAFYIDTIIRTEKKGDWRRLWQDSQSGIFIVRGKVLAGLDLDKLGADNVNIVDDKVLISLPAVEILSVDLEISKCTIFRPARLICCLWISRYLRRCRKKRNGRYCKARVRLRFWNMPTVKRKRSWKTCLR